LLSNKIIPANNIIKTLEKYIVSPSKGIICESFDNIGKSTTIDETYKSMSKHNLGTSGLGVNGDKVGSRYCANDDKDGVTTTGTWDMRKSTSYVAKAYKQPKHSNYIKNPGSLHK
jgi:hypothetical protein